MQQDLSLDGAVCKNMCFSVQTSVCMKTGPSIKTRRSASGQSSLQEERLLCTDNKIPLWTVQFARRQASLYKQRDLSLQSAVCKKTGISLQTTRSVTGQCSLQEHMLPHTNNLICLWTVQFARHASPYRQQGLSLECSLQEHRCLHTDNKICLWTVWYARTPASPCRTQWNFYQPECSRVYNGFLLSIEQAASKHSA